MTCTLRLGLLNICSAEKSDRVQASIDVGVWSLALN